MTGPYFVDTNIFVYARDRSDKKKHRLATEVLHRVWESGEGRTSIQVLNELFSVLTSKFGVEDSLAVADVESLLSWDPSPVDREAFELALIVRRHYRLSWWDSLIIASASIQRCKIILSEDLSDGGKYQDLIVVNPFEHKFSLSS